MELRTAQPRVESIPKGLSMSEFVATDSILRQSKRRPYSNDLGARVIEAIDAGYARREAADRS